ncbi:hypothetical protein O181_044708 [Austropuccinia psidii MF-1]|uniref:Uncharacterized protein n=1 Tax=Austropuccinia psidii MF-1 TaxID=1389203 RepID=A0A9Q3DNU1_9BASI|nr:hypothetical protein [Austropuccinia psidii MF-1]
MSSLNHPYASTCLPHSLCHSPCLRSRGTLNIGLCSHHLIIMLCYPLLQSPKYIPLTPPSHFLFHPSMPFCAPAKNAPLLQRLTALTPTLPPHPYVSTHPPNSLLPLQSL